MLDSKRFLSVKMTFKLDPFSFTFKIQARMSPNGDSRSGEGHFSRCFPSGTNYLGCSLFFKWTCDIFTPLLRNNQSDKSNMSAAESSSCSFISINQNVLGLFCESVEFSSEVEEKQCEQCIFSFHRTPSNMFLNNRYIFNILHNKPAKHFPHLYFSCCCISGL